MKSEMNRNEMTAERKKSNTHELVNWNTGVQTLRRDKQTQREAKNLFLHMNMLEVSIVGLLTRSEWSNLETCNFRVAQAEMEETQLIFMTPQQPRARSVPIEISIISFTHFFSGRNERREKLFELKSKVFRVDFELICNQIFLGIRNDCNLVGD